MTETSRPEVQRSVVSNVVRAGGCVLFSFGLCDSDDSEDQPPDEPGAGRQERVHEQQQDVVRHV